MDKILFEMDDVMREILNGNIILDKVQPVAGLEFFIISEIAFIQYNDNNI